MVKIGPVRAGSGGSAGGPPCGIGATAISKRDRVSTSSGSGGGGGFSVPGDGDAEYGDGSGGDGRGSVIGQVEPVDAARVHVGRFNGVVVAFPVGLGLVRLEGVARHHVKQRQSGCSEIQNRNSVDIKK